MMFNKDKINEKMKLFGDQANIYGKITKIEKDNTDRKMYKSVYPYKLMCTSMIGIVAIGVCCKYFVKGFTLK